LQQERSFGNYSLTLQPVNHLLMTCGSLHLSLNPLLFGLQLCYQRRLLLRFHKFFSLPSNHTPSFIFLTNALAKPASVNPKTLRFLPIAFDNSMAVNIVIIGILSFLAARFTFSAVLS